MSQETKTEVLYNAACPVCRHEIDHYARLSQDQALPIRYDDLNAPEMAEIWGIDPDTAARRLHVRKSGETLSGIPAFIALWQDIPRYHWLARFVSTPGVHGLAVLIYDWVLAPALYVWDKRRRRKAETQDRASASR